MKQMNGDIWFNPVNVTDPDIVTDIQTDRSLKKAHVVSITSGLVPDVEYTFRVDIVASEYDKLLKRAVPGEPSKAILYKCDSKKCFIFDVILLNSVILCSLLYRSSSPQSAHYLKEGSIQS